MTSAPRPPRRRRPAALAAALVAVAFPAGCGTNAEGDRPVPGPPVGAEIFRGDFERGDLTGWGLNDGDGLQLGGGDDRLRVVSSPTREGEFAGRFEVRDGDSWKGAPGERTQACYDEYATEGQRRTYTWSTRFDEDYPGFQDGYQLWFQWHAKLSGPSQAPLQFIATGDEIGFNVVESDDDAEPVETNRLWRGPMQRGDWQDFRLEVRWSADPDEGTVRLSVDGEEVVPETRVATLIPGYPNYVCLGLYRSDDVGETAVLYHDGFIITQDEGGLHPDARE